MKTFLRFFTFLLISVLIVGCGDISLELDAPMNVSIQDGIVTWDLVTDATEYIVAIGTNTYSVTTNSFDTTNLGLPEGEYQIHVVAKSETGVSLPSQTITLNIDAPTIVLDAPANVTIQDGIVTWDVVANATEYDVTIAIHTYSVTTNSFDTTTLDLPVGDYQIQVIAKNEAGVSSPSTAVTLSITNSAVIVDTPSNVTLTDNILTWDAVLGATGYVVTIGDESVSVVLTTLDLDTLDLLPGTYNIHVVAKISALSSSASATVTYVIEAADLSSIYAAVLLVIDDSFVPDMTKADFILDEKYEEYLLQSQLSLTFSESVVALGLSEVEAIALFTQIFELSDSMEPVSDVSALILEIDAFDTYGIDSADLSYLFLNLAVTAIELEIDFLSQEILFEQARLAILEQDLVTARALGMDPVYALLLVHATPEEALLLEEFFKGEYEQTYLVLNYVSNIASDFRQNPANDPYYLNEGLEYVQLFYDILEKAAIADDTSLLELIMNGGAFLNLYLVIDSYNLVQKTTDRIARYTEESASLSELKAVFIDQEEMILESMILVFDYLSLVYDSIPASLILNLDKLGEDTELTLEEYLLIKDEITSILLTTLPSADDFAQLHTTMFTVTSALSGVDLDAHLPYVGFYGAIDHATLDLALTFIDEIDLTTITEIDVIVDGMVILGRGSYFDPITEMWMYEPDIYDYDKVIELSVYIGLHIQYFKTHNADKFLTLETLLDSNQMKSVLILFANSLKETLELELSPEEFLIAEMIIDEVIADYDLFKEGLDIAKDLGTDVIQEFLSTQGAMFSNIIALSEFDGAEPNQQFIADLEVIISQALSYNSTILDNMDASTIEKLLELSRIPLLIQLTVEGDMTRSDFDLIFDDLLPPVSIVMANTITLQKEFVSAVDALDFEALLYDSNWSISGENAYNVLAIMAIDDTYTLQNAALVVSTFATLSDIFKNPTLMTFTNTTGVEVDAMIAVALLEIQTMAQEAKVIAAFDFTAINPMQQAIIDQFVLNYFD